MTDAAAHAVKSDPDELAEVLDFIDDSEVKPSQTWQALAFVRRLRHMQKVPFYEPVWQNLVDQGIEKELPAFDAALHDVQDYEPVSSSATGSAPPSLKGLYDGRGKMHLKRLWRGLLGSKEHLAVLGEQHSSP